MSSDPGDYPGRSSGPGRRPQGASQGASRGGSRPDDTDDSPAGSPPDDYAAPGGRSAGGAPFGGFPFGSDRSRNRGGRSATFLGLPVTLIYAIGAAIIGIVIIGAVCGRPGATATGTVAGQVKALNTDRSVATLAGAQVVVRGSSQSYTATSTDVPANAEGEAAYNYRIENVPPGTYTMAVTPPAGSNLQPEQDITFEVESGQLFPQSVMLLAEGIQKPRALTQSELRPGEAGGYINERGERVVYQQGGGGFDATDALLLYLLWRNPGGWGYGYPPVIVNSPGSSSPSGYNYRVSDPPTQTRGGQTVTQQKPSTPGQGATRPSSGTGATGSGPSYSSGTGSSGSSGGTSSGSSSSTTSSGSSGSSSSTQTKPSTSSGSGSSVSAPSVPSQGAARPSSSSSSPSRSSAPSRSSSGSSSGGRR